MLLRASLFSRNRTSNVFFTGYFLVQVSFATCVTYLFAWVTSNSWIYTMEKKEKKRKKKKKHLIFTVLSTFFCLARLHRRSKFANCCHDLMQNYLS